MHSQALGMAPARPGRLRREGATDVDYSRSNTHSKVMSGKQGFRRSEVPNLASLFSSPALASTRITACVSRHGSFSNEGRVGFFWGGGRGGIHFGNHSLHHRTMHARILPKASA